MSQATQNLFLTGQVERHEAVPASYILCECEAVMFLSRLSKA